MQGLGEILNLKAHFAHILDFRSTFCDKARVAVTIDFKYFVGTIQQKFLSHMS